MLLMRDVRNVADLLHALGEAQRLILNAEPLKHGPTIGEMYEGLSKDLLSLSLVDEDTPELVIGSGFIEYDDKSLSGQLDCVVAFRTLRPVPNTTRHYFDPRDVLAVIEIKKTAMGADISEAVDHLKPLTEHLWGPPDRIVDAHFSFLTGRIVDVPLDKLPQLYWQLRRCIDLGTSSPLRIVWGFNGYVRHQEFREGVLNAITKEGLQFDQVPNLIISGPHVATVEDGLPWNEHRIVDSWDFISTHVGLPPVYFILECLWARIRLRAESLMDLRGDTTGLPRLRPLLRFVGLDEFEPELCLDPAPENGDMGVETEWKPIELSSEEETAFSFLHTDALRALMRDVVRNGGEEGAKLLAAMHRLVEKRIAKQSLADPEAFYVMDPENIMVATETGVLVNDARSWRFFSWLWAQRSKANES